MIRLFLVAAEQQGSSEAKLGVFVRKGKAEKAFKCLCDELNPNNRFEYLKVRDEANNKRYMWTDGNYGWSVYLRVMRLNEIYTIL